MRDRYRILKKLNFRRSVNAAKVYTGFWWSRISRNPKPWGLPMALSIEPTTSCNLRCPECPSGLRSFSRPTGMLDEQLFRETIDAVSGHLLYLTMYFQGEPYLNPKFLDMVKYAASKKIYTATSTNAHYLDDEQAKKTIASGLDRLIISIDGATQETYVAYRIGGRLDKVLEGTRNLVKWKKELRSKTPHLVFQFLVVRPNEHEIEAVRKIAEDIGVDEILFKTAQVYEYQNGNELIPENDAYSRYRRNADGTWSVKNSLDNHCWKMWHSGVITWDGLMVPCCFDKDATHRMGDLKKQSLQSIWHGEAYMKFRSTLLRSRSEIDICKNCSEGTKVWA